MSKRTNRQTAGRNPGGKQGRAAARASTPRQGPRAKTAADMARARRAAGPTQATRGRGVGAALAAGIAVVALVVAFIVLRGGSEEGERSDAGPASVEMGAVAPDGKFTTIDGQANSVAGLRGEPVLLWLIATWCSSCQAGTQALADGGIDQLERAGVDVVQLKMHENLGGPDEDMADFVNRYAPSARGNRAWTFGTASAELTRTYNPQGYLDIYFLLDAQGRVRFVNTAPAGTLGKLLEQAAALDTPPGGSTDDAAGQVSIEGVRTYPDLSRNHVSARVRYPRTPPVGGDHAPVWQNCDGAVYDQPPPDERAVHSLEHGAVWVTYRPGLPAEQLARLRELVDGSDYRMLSPYPDQPAPVIATAWGSQLALKSADDTRLPRFLDAHTQGPQTPEPGAPCDGGLPTP